MVTVSVPRVWNWPLWAGFLLSVLAFLSYFLFFAEFPLTRDFPWANLLLFGLAAALLAAGIRHAFRRPEIYRGKIFGPVLTGLAVLIFGLFIFFTFVLSRQLPHSAGAPRVGAKAPDFTLVDTRNQSVSLTDLLAGPIHGGVPKAVLLVFYRGYW